MGGRGRVRLVPWYAGGWSVVVFVVAVVSSGGLCDNNFGGLCERGKSEDVALWPPLKLL